MVSSVNHELDTKWSHINTAGAAIVNEKSYNLFELKNVDAFLACNKVVHKVNRLITEYRKEQNELFDKGMKKKEPITRTLTHGEMVTLHVAIV